MKLRSIQILLISALLTLLLMDVSARGRKQDVQQNLSSLRIDINIPAYRLDLFHGDDLMKSYMVAVGMPYFRTTRRKFLLTRMMWRPWWYPPSSDWASGSGSSPPGPRNPLGPVKMMLGRTNYLIHGTNKPESIGHTSSHGCIRMFSEDAVELAWTIMVMAGTVDPIKTPQEYINTKGSTVVTLRSAVVVRTVYRRIEIRDNRLLLHPDPYRMDHVGLNTIKKVLAENNYPEDSLSEEEMNSMLGYAMHGTISKLLRTSSAKLDVELKDKQSL